MKVITRSLIAKVREYRKRHKQREYRSYRETAFQSVVVNEIYRAVPHVLIINAEELQMKR
jgi:hypothetical protein